MSSSTTPTAPTAPQAIGTGGSGETLAAMLEDPQSLRTLGPAWLGSVRDQAIAKANELGLPTRKQEEWRYTNPKRIVEAAYASPVRDIEPDAAAVQPLDLDHAARLVFIDGAFAPDASELDRLPAGVTALPFDHATPQPSDEDRETIEQLAGEGVAASRDGFEALGAGLASHGVLIRVAGGAALEHPVVLVFRSEANATPTLTAPLVNIVLEPGAEARVIEDHQGDENAAGLTLGRTNLRVDRDARLEHVVLEREPADRHHVSTLHLVQQGHSFARTHRVLLGGGIVRNNVLATIEGEHAESAFNGLFLPEHKQHHDNHVRVEHMAPHCHSRQYYRGLLADDARGVFTGRIYVKDIAQKTDAVQSNANLLLSPTAQVTAKPQLEIYADDVKCTHGATSGELDEEALFYLRTRGVEERTARLLLLHAFAGDNLNRIQ
ncbi:MAG: Fe-S cluster assembly protein SufD, partial [Phycisphaeraceae bacterium]